MSGFNQIQTIGGVDGGVGSLKRPLNAGHLDGDLIPAKKEALEGLNAMGDSDKVVDVYQVPEKVVGLVIGKGGSEIRNLQQTSGCRVQMDPDHQSVNGFRNCTIEGPPQQVALVRQLIDNILSRNQGSGGGSGHGGEVTEEMLIPAEKCGLVIGKGGETIRTVQEQAGLRSINVVQDSHAPTGQPKPLRMVGVPSAIETAKMLVMNIMNNQQGGGNQSQMRTGYGGGGQEAPAKGEVIVPRMSAGMIIGRGGEMIKRLAQETGTKIQFKPDENPNSSDRVAIIMGTRDQIYRATERITEIVNRAIKNNGGSAQQSSGGSGLSSGGSNVFYLHVPANKCGLVIGKGGENIKQIERETGASCGLAPASEQKKEDEKVFEIKGTPQQIHHASHLVKIKVGEIAPNTPVPPFQGSYGYGAAGQNGGYQAAGGAAFVQPQPAQPYGIAQQWGQNGATAVSAAAHHQLQAADVYQQAAAVQPQAVVPQAVQADPVAPTVNPTTGAPDYSAQWAAYYRSIGLMDQAAMVENQMRRNQTTGDASGAVAGQPQAYYPHPQ